MEVDFALWVRTRMVFGLWEEEKMGGGEWRLLKLMMGCGSWEVIIILDNYTCRN